MKLNIGWKTLKASKRRTAKLVIGFECKYREVVLIALVASPAALELFLKAMKHVV